MGCIAVDSRLDVQDGENSMVSNCESSLERIWEDFRFLSVFCFWNYQRLLIAQLILGYSRVVATGASEQRMSGCRLNCISGLTYECGIGLSLVAWFYGTLTFKLPTGMGQNTTLLYNDADDTTY